MLDAMEYSESNELNEFINLPSLNSESELNTFCFLGSDMLHRSSPLMYDEGSVDNGRNTGERDSLLVTSENNNIDNNENDEMRIETSEKQMKMKIESNESIENLPKLERESEFERSIKRKLCEIESISIIEVNERCENVKRKKMKSCRSINSKYRDGFILNKEMSLSEEDINKYKELEKDKIECDYCKKNESINKILKVCNLYNCCEKCLKERKIELSELKNDLFEEFDYSNEVLYKCNRLDHSRPLHHYIKYSKRNNSYRIVSNCCYCRLYKSQENELKKKRKQE